MKASEVLKKEIIYRWAEEIAKEIEDDSILILKYDLVATVWIEEINRLIPSIKMVNACTRLTCPKTCFTCVNVIEAIRKKETPLCINCKSLKLLYVKVSEMRYHPVKIIDVDRSVMCFMEELEDVNIIDANDTTIFLAPKIYSYIRVIDTEYRNPVLVVNILKYLEYEKSMRQDRNMDAVIHGIKVSFLYDPMHIETTRMNLYRQNKTEKIGTKK